MQLKKGEYMKDQAIYRNVYFRIEAGYKWSEGMEEENLKDFNDEIRKIFSSLGFTIKEPEYANSCIEVERGAENLYCHPRDLVGEIKQDNIKGLEDILKQAESFSFRYTDVYDTLFNYTLDELKQELESIKEKIISDILELFKTKRKNLYKPFSLLWDYKTSILFFRDKLELKEMKRDFINNTFVELVKQGRIKESENSKIGKIYQTIK